MEELCFFNWDGFTLTFLEVHLRARSLVYLRQWTWSQRSMSFWPWQSHPCRQCGCISEQRWTLGCWWHPAQSPRSLGLALPATYLWGEGRHKQTNKTTLTQLIRLWVYKTAITTSTEPLRNNKSWREMKSGKLTVFWLMKGMHTNVERMRKLWVIGRTLGLYLFRLPHFTIW